MKSSLLPLALLICGAVVAQTSSASDAHQHSALPVMDKRADLPSAKGLEDKSRAAAAERLRKKLPQLEISVDQITGGPSSIAAHDGFLTGANARGRALPDEGIAGSGGPHHALKAFVHEYRDLFGHGLEVLEDARIVRDYVTEHNGLRTVIWEQSVDGIPVYGGKLSGFITKRGELVKVSSHFLPDAESAADRWSPKRRELVKNPGISAGRAVVLAGENIGEHIGEGDLVASRGEPKGQEKIQGFRGASLHGEADVQLTWLPMGRDWLRLCWQVEVKRREDGVLYRVLLDAQSGEVLLRVPRTFQLSDATYRVFTSDSPAPWSPGPANPTTSQATNVSRVLLTLSALDTNASPLGWITDGENETRGNNVDAHLDRVADDLPDLPRPQGSPFRVFDFPLDLNQSPTTYGDAVVVQMFYWCNWYHDKLYALGFTEAAGNYQKDNLGRGGVQGDPIMADGQDGSGFENANFSLSPRDGDPARMQMYIFPASTPARDSGLDALVIIHELTHGLHERLLGENGWTTETYGMFEGWGDFYAIALLSEASDNPDGTYPEGGYIDYLFRGSSENYYFGIRRYPYSTDMAKNPLTYKDIDPVDASTHPGIPVNPINTSAPSAVHRMGEVWCATLWDVRTAMVRKHGFTNGTQIALRLVTDGMKLAAPGSFLGARSGIFSADQVNNGGANYNELWAAFAKRGMGVSAQSHTWVFDSVANVTEAYNVPSSTTKLGITLPGPTPENAGTIVNGGSVTLTKTLSSNLVVSLAVAQPQYLTVPANVTILAGQLSASFNITVSNNTLVDGTHWAFVTATALPLSSATAGLEIRDDEVHHFTFDTISSPQTVNSGFNVTVRAKDTNQNTATSFNGTVQLSGATPSATRPSIVVSEIWVLTTTTSNGYNLRSEIEFANVSGTNVDISNWQIVLYDRTTWPYPQQTFVIPTNILSKTNDLFRLRTGLSTSFTQYPGSYTNFVSPTHVAWDNSLSNNAIAVLLRDATGAATDFVCAVDADPTQITVPMAIPASVWSGSAVPGRGVHPISYQRIGSADRNNRFDWIATGINSMTALNSGMTLPFTKVDSVPISPTTSGNFVSGVWTGSVTVSSLANNMTLRADDGSGHYGESSPFSVGATSDLSPLVQAAPSHITPGNLLTYTITLTNTGPSTATSVFFTNLPPTYATIETFSTSQGSCSIAGGNLVCNVGTIFGSGIATVTVNVRVGALGPNTNVIKVVRGESDGVPANNTLSVVTEVTQPLFFSAFARVVEGNSGQSVANVPVWLSGSNTATVTVNYATVDGMATSVSGDYVSASGTVTFTPGITNTTIALQVNGDTLSESNELFGLVFSNPVNAKIAVPQSLIQITNDDTHPSLTIADTTVTEGNSGSVNANFTLNLSGPSGQSIRVSASTPVSSWSAAPYVDFDAKSAVVIFAPGVTNLTMSVPVYGDVFYEGNETFYFTLSASLQPVTITDGTGVCTIIDDDAASLHHFDLSTVSSPQFTYQPFSLTVTAKDSANNVQSSFNGSANIRASRNSQMLTLGFGSDIWPYPLGTYFHDHRLQSIYLASQINRSGNIRSLAVDVFTPASQSLNNFTIRMKHTTLTNYPANPGWDASGWTTVYQSTTVVATNSWNIFHLSTPFAYNGTDHLMVDFSFNNTNYTTDGKVRFSTTTGNRSLFFSSDSTLGDPLTWSGTSPAPHATNRVPNIQIDIDSPIAITPTTIGPFASGSWTGNITVQNMGVGSASGVRLSVIDGANHYGSGNTFDVYDVNDVPSFVKGPDQTVLTNSGQRTVAGWATSISAGPNEPWQVVDFIVTNNNNALFSVQPAISADGTLTFTPAQNAAGLATVSVRLHDNGGTAYGGVDTSAEQTFAISVSLHTVVITASDPSAQETGDNGQFTVTRSGGDNSSAMTVLYTVSGTATAGSDYAALSGSVSIPAGQASATIPVTIYDDTSYEWNETVVGTLASSLNYVIGSPSSATVTINSFFDMGVPAGTTGSKAFDINNAGYVVGFFDTNSDTRAFFTTTTSVNAASDMHPFISGFFGATNQGGSVAWSVTPNYAYGGEFTHNGVTKSWYRAQYPSSGIQQLNAPSSTQNFLRALVDCGSGYSQGAGFSMVNGYNQFCHWIIYDATPSSTYVYNIGGSIWPTNHSYAYGLMCNKLVGYVTYPTGNKAVIWDWNYSGSGPTYLHAASGGTQTESYDLNTYYSYTYIVGYSQSNNVRTACYWTYTGYSSYGLTASLLPKPSGWTNSVANGLNSNHQIVGNYYQPSSPNYEDRRAILWQVGSPVLLNSIVPAGVDWVLNSAERINSYNQIVGYGSTGGQVHAFRLNP